MAWVCSCNAFNTATINAAIAECTAAPRATPLRALHVHQELGATPQCAKCKPLIDAMIATAAETTQNKLPAAAAPFLCPLKAAMQAARAKSLGQGAPHRT